MSYKSIHTGQQIDAGVSAALNPDTTPTAGSDALITSGGTKAALDGKQNTLTFDSTPTAGSSNPVTSDGIKSALSTFVRPNLLDNWYFVGGGSQQGGGQFPINQRGQTTYSNGGYTIDRWEKNQYFGGTINIISAGLNLVADSAGLRIQQKNEQRNILLQKTGTFSVLTSDGSLYSITFPIGSATGGTSLGDKMIFYSTSDFAVVLDVRANNEVTIAAMKLEVGHDQTLAHQENGAWVMNEIPDYQQVLEKCQSVYLDLGSGAGPVYIGAPYSSTEAVLFVPTPVAMRSPLMLSFVGGSLWQDGVAHSIVSVGINELYQNGVKLIVNSSGLTAYSSLAGADFRLRLYTQGLGG